MRRTDETPRRAGQEERGPRSSGSGHATPAVAATGRSAGDPSSDDTQVFRRKRAARPRCTTFRAWARPWFNFPLRGCPSSACPSASPTRSNRRARSARWEARRRQMQFIGRLMRDVDPLPIQARLEQWAGAPNAEKARLAHVERWRTRLLSDAVALDQLCAAVPHADRARLSALVVRVQGERARAAPPHAYRELFRVLNTLLPRLERRRSLMPGAGRAGAGTRR